MEPQGRVQPGEVAATSPPTEAPRTGSEEGERLDLRVCLPLLSVHAGCLLLPWAGVSGISVALCLALVVVRAFGLSAGYHRGFAHRSFATSRPFQLALACLGASAAQLGPLWWVAHHRAHHRFSDTARDPHSPGVRGLWWAHLGWLLCRKHSETRLALVPDLARYPELRFLDQHPGVVPGVLAGLLYGLGELLSLWAPGLHTSGFQLLVWGFFLSTTLLYHVTFAVNSLGHRFGSQRYDSTDESGNSFWLALVTLGDGWHHNHHRFPASARHGFHWWEIDPTWLALRLLARLRLVWDLREPPVKAYLPAARARRRGSTSAAITLTAHTRTKASPTRA